MLAVIHGSASRNSGTWSTTRSSHFSLPSCTSSAIAAAVNALLHEAMLNRLVAVIFASCPRCPSPTSASTAPSWTTASARPVAANTSRAASAIAVTWAAVNGVGVVVAAGAVWA